MKKSIKCLSAVLMTSVLAVLAGATAMPAFAESSITITSSSTGTHTYKAYQILTGSASGDALGNPAFGANLSLSAELLAALKADEKFGEGTANLFYSLTTESTAANFAEAIHNLSDDAQKQEFARVIGKYVTGDGIAVSSTATAVADGYYIVKDETATLPDHQARTINLLKVAGEVNIDTKEKVPTSEKTVDDKNDSDSADSLNQTAQKSADYDIGDHIPYTLTFTLPENYAMFTEYPVTFIDDMCPGLTLDTGSVKIWYGDVTGEGTSIAFTEDTSTASSYTVGTTNGKVYKYEIGDLKTSHPSFTSGTITIKYTATLNSNAVIGSAGNENKYKVAFANDPNWQPNPADPTEEPPTSETPDQKSIVFTYELIINKTDGTNALTGADFTLYKWIPSETGADTYNTAKGNWTAVSNKTGTTAGSTFTFNGLDDGIYKLSETTTPQGYNTISDKIFTISAEHSASGITSLTSTGGLTIEGNATNGTLTAIIANQKGVELPGTGGMGTTIFYIVGGLMVTGALVLLIVRKRMNIKEK